MDARHEVVPRARRVVDLIDVLDRIVAVEEGGADEEIDIGTRLDRGSDIETSVDFALCGQRFGAADDREPHATPVVGVDLGVAARRWILVPGGTTTEILVVPDVVSDVRAGRE